MIFDTHAHYDSGAFNADRDEILSSMPETNVGLIVDPGCDLKSSLDSISLAEKYAFVYAAVGWHPEDMDKLSDESFSEMAKLITHPKCVAVGEIGLDYYWDTEHKQEQKDLFIRQIELALDLDKPVIVHDREAHGDSFDIVSRYPNLRGVFHCYSGSREMAEQLLKNGWYLGFDGPITYKNARKSIEVLEMCPLDRIVIETDSPYLTPVPNRGKRNDSSNLKYVIEKIAEIKGMAAAEVEQITFENGRRLYGIGDM
jgi:TatD DNase family protein